MTEGQASLIAKAVVYRLIQQGLLTDEQFDTIDWPAVTEAVIEAEHTGRTE